MESRKVFIWKAERSLESRTEVKMRCRYLARGPGREGTALYSVVNYPEVTAAEEVGSSAEGRGVVLLEELPW